MCGEGGWSYVGRSALCSAHSGLSGSARGRERSAEVSRGHSSRLADQGPNDGQGQSDDALMRAERQKIQLELALESVAKGEARSAGGQGKGPKPAWRVPTPHARLPGRETVDGGDPASLAR